MAEVNLLLTDTFEVFTTAGENVILTETETETEAVEEWYIYGSTGAWALYDPSNSGHTSILQTGNSIFWRYDSISGNSVQVTPIIPVAGDYDIYILPLDTTSYVSGTLIAAVEDTGGNYYPLSSSGLFNRAAILGSASELRAGIIKGPILPNMRIYADNLSGGGSSSIVLVIIKNA